MQYLDLSAQYETVIVSGDIHGEFRTLVHTIVRKHIENAVVIVAGDCGFGFMKLGYYDQLYKQHLHKKLAQRNVLLLMVRGNHDDPAYFEGEVIDYPYMKTLPDYTIVHTASLNILCLGGAISIDRNFRLSTMAYNKILKKESSPLYWLKETVNYDETELAILETEQIKVNNVITHTAPSFCPPFTKGDLEHWCANDENLASDIKKERKDMDKLYHYLTTHNHPLQNWYYGHYHTSVTHQQDSTLFHLLDIMELKLISY